MTKNKSTKRALLLSALSLLLCVSMLVGSTFAWFTDSVTSGQNTIQSGNLDVELYYTYDAAVAADETSTAWEKVTSTTDIFGYDRWEPGYTKVAYFKVVNEGSLELKYQLAADVYEEKPGKNQAGAEFLLSDYINTALVEVGATRNEILAMEGTPLKASYSMSKGSLAANDTVVVGLAIWMPTTVGNVANHDGNTVPEITFGINLLATQMTAESDSFGSDYDKDAVYTDAVVTSEEELKEALANAREGAIIGIRGNVTWTTGAGIGSTPFIEAASTYSLRAAKSVKNITLVGMDETAVFTATGKGVGAIGIDGGTVTFKNLKIVDESVSYAENNWEYGYLEFRGNTVFEDCNIVNAIMMEGDSATFKNCFFNSNKDNEYAVWVSNGNASFENCYFTGARGLKIHEAYGSEVGTVVANNNTFIDLSKKPGLAIGDVNVETTVTLTNNQFIGTQAGDQGNYKFETDTDTTTFSFTDSENFVAGYADTTEDLKGSLTNNATVVMGEGEYSLPSLSGKEGITLIGTEGTVIGGENASTGFGSNFGKDTTIKNVTFSGSSNGVRWSYAQGGTSVFENCTFAGDSTYGFHIDESNGATFIFNNCTFIGFNAFAGDLEKIEFNNCTFLSNGNYGNTNVWNVAYYNNCTWGEGAGMDVKAGTEIYVDGVRAASNVTSLKEILSQDKNLVLLKDITFTGEKTADRNNYVEAYGNKVGFAQYSGVLDGNGKTLTDSEGDKSYVVVTHGGTIKNLTLKTGARGIVTYSPTENVYIDNVIVDGPGYALNSTEHGAVEMVVTNSTVNGWTSLAGFKSVSFTNCKLGENSIKYWQSMGYSQDYDRLFRIYSATTFTSCEFEQGYYLDLSAGGTLTLIDCTVNGVEITAENYADYVTIELPVGKTLADCAVFG